MDKLNFVRDYFIVFNSNPLFVLLCGELSEHLGAGGGAGGNAFVFAFCLFQCVLYCFCSYLDFTSQFSSEVIYVFLLVM